MGSTDSPVPINGVGTFLGASACEPRSSVVKKILDGATPTYFTQAGTFDSAFAGITATYLQNPARVGPAISPAIDRITAGN